MNCDLGWKPDPRSAVPLFLQIKEFIKGKIESGEWPVGTQIPTQRALARSFEVNRSTVVAALEELKADGLIQGKSGSGTRVVNHSWSLLSSSAPPDWNAYVRAGIHPPNLPAIQEINRAEFDPHVIRLGTGELSPQLYPREMMKQVMGSVSDRIHSLGYEEPKGLLPLREQLSEYLRTIGIEASPSSILIVSGALQALQLIAFGLLQQGSSVFLERPSYLYSLNVFQSAGVRLFGVPMDESGMTTTVITEQKKRRNAALLYTISSFHNPTGITMSAERRQELLRMCEQEQLPIIEDDVYRELWLDEPPPPPLKALDKNGLVLYLGSISKTLSPGLRIGWVTGPESVIDRLADIKMQTDYGSSSLSQWVATEWLASGKYFEHLDQIRRELRIRRDIALEALEDHLSGLAEWPIPKGGFYIWMRLFPSLSLRELFEQALKEGILINPGNVYDGNDSCHLRLSYSYASPGDLQNGIRRLSKLIQKLSR
ncbi:PLP-dependent aminotransferase family protein [Lihuaxuella thermophila]|uniref:GntR family transcriptional regulator, regulator for abcA and norABC n=1 Tax=Lihuaxuella thermophila TaxID=1173111 RepID=A0A1H8ITG2_9BACL|nr:PLP-dependent aminotransferase family protein [Lihuaxuella thermophila]SEN71287.1 GntR family transcriptional regulator, regulator for abcA and norABC [Lihuaxuella thermophila]